MHVFFSVGEPSGDQHGAHLIEELRRRSPGLRVSGFGGPLMERSGCSLLYRLTDLAVMGFLAVVPLIWKFYRLIKQAERFLREERPDAVVLIDFPGFNWWIARKAKKAGIPVFYYLPPQLWAWAPWRLRKMKKFVDHVLCGLSFEPEWYAERGMKVDFVGHPFFDEVAEHKLDAEFCRDQTNAPGPLVGVLPGSRNHEVHNLFPAQVEAMRQVRTRVPNVRFVVANYRESHREFCRLELERSQAEHAGEPPLRVEFHVGRTSEIIEVADFCLMASGSVSLEMLARRTPALVIYYCKPRTYWILRNVLRISLQWASLPNIMVSRTVLPEILLCYDPPAETRQIAEVMTRWLEHPAERQAVADELDAIANRYGQTGATARAAETILARLGVPAATPARRAA